MSSKAPMTKPEKGRASWQNRRKVIFAALYFCAFCILFILFQGKDTRINETIALGCFGLAGSIIGFYVAGAAWTDVSVEKIKAGYSSNSSSNEQAYSYNTAAPQNAPDPTPAQRRKEAEHLKDVEDGMDDNEQ